MTDPVSLSASLAGIIGFSLKLSITLYDFASTLGTAGRDVRQLGSDVTLFCAVLKQVQSVLGKAKGCRASLTAIESTQEVVDRCQQVFGQIQEVIGKLQNEETKAVSVASKIK